MHKWTGDILAEVFVSRNDQGNQVKVRNVLTLRPAPRIEFRGVVAVIVKLAGRAIFAQNYQDAY